MQALTQLHRCRIALTIVAIVVSVTVSAGWARVRAQDEPAGGAGSNQQRLLLPAQEDAYVRGRQPAQNFGAAPTLLVGRQSLLGGEIIETFDTLVRWDTSSLPPGTKINKAELGLYQTGYTPSTGGNDVVLIDRVTTPWDAATVTWATRPESTTIDRTWVPPADTGQYHFRDITGQADQWVNAPGNVPNYGLLLRYGNSNGFAARSFESREAPGRNVPLLAVEYTLPPVRVCLDTVDPCNPAVGAEVFDRARGRLLTVSDPGGLLPADAVGLDDQLWVRLPVKGDYPQAQLFYTTPGVTTVAARQFQVYNDTDAIELRLLVRSDKPLLLYDLNLSAQWLVESDKTFADQLERNIVRASDYLYSFTNGQFALGVVTVRQAYEGWDAADIKLHTSNVLHPNATIGGIVLTETQDIAPTVPISYLPGSVFMGSYWNRFGTPPNQQVTVKGVVITPDQLVDDWSIALAHELGHYLLFLFDTYTDKNGVSNAAIAAQCTGSAMGDAYQPGNQAFVFDQPAWDANCGATEAHFRLNGRTEWATIKGWYNFAVVPSTVGTGATPPVPLTSVVFVSPTVKVDPLASQVFSLTYQLNQTSSGEARAFLLRNDSLIFEQGKPAKGTTSVQLIDARVNDRLCVFDINDHAESPDTPRHQFGCEIIQLNDSNLVMTNDPAWNPTVTIEQTGPQQLSVTVQQELADGLTLRARLIPETDEAGPLQVLSRSGDTWSTVFNLPGPVAPVYLQLWVDETPAAPQTRREVLADRGTGGNGAYGPARHHGGVFAVSSDGNASYQTDEPLELEPGQSVAWQSMPGTPPVPPWKRISGQSYRLDAFPAALVNGGQVSIEYEDGFGVLAAGAGLNPRAMTAPVAQIHFWDGQVWRALPTTLGTPASAEDGVQLATAPSQGVGVYAVMIDSKPALFMPTVKK
jgi:hypothetical protein